MHKEERSVFRGFHKNCNSVLSVLTCKINVDFFLNFLFSSLEFDSSHKNCVLDCHTL